MATPLDSQAANGFSCKMATAAKGLNEADVANEMNKMVCA